MYPNAFLKTFWQMETKPQVFVAMSFDDIYKDRYSKIIRPAIESVSLKPIRVDESASGDSLHTQIIDGICHSRLILADVSTFGVIDEESKEHRFRNGNVIYEVGLAIACRQPAEVVLVCDERDKERDDFLFDVRAIPHNPLDFADILESRNRISKILHDRLTEIKLALDARVAKAISALTGDEILRLRDVAGNPNFSPTVPWYLPDENARDRWGVERLLDKGIVVYNNHNSEGYPQYRFTDFGYEVARIVENDLRHLPNPTQKPTEEKASLAL